MTTQEQIDLLDEETAITNQMIAETTAQINSLEEAVTNQTVLLTDYNNQIAELNVKLANLNASNATRAEIKTTVESQPPT